MSEFKGYHPIVNFVYFVLVIGFGCYFMHPLCLGISLVSGFTHSVIIKGKGAVKTNLIYMLPTALAMLIINPVFNHQGVTIVGYFPNGNPLTAESVIYGLCASLMIINVICHFSCYNEVLTSDKFIYLFGKIIPAMSLIISMTLRFVPRFFTQLKVVTNAQKCMGRDMGQGNVFKRIKHGLNILGIMITWSLENAIETADSMKSRGYGMAGRTAFSVFNFDKRDKKALVFILTLGSYTLFGSIMGATYFNFFPCIKKAEFSLFGISVFTAYFVLCIYPVIIEIREAIKWKYLRSKI